MEQNECFPVCLFMVHKKNEWEKIPAVKNLVERLMSGGCFRLTPMVLR